MSSSATRGPLTTVSGWRTRTARELSYSDRLPLLVLSLTALTFVVAGFVWPGLMPYNAMLLPMFVGSLWLGPRSVPWFVVGCLLGVCAIISVQPVITARGLIQIGITFLIGLLILISSYRRRRLGVSGPRSESMFVDLRDRISKQGRLPSVPRGWQIEAVIRSAGGTGFAGDFVVGSRDAERNTVEVVVVDVSGKGVEAGSRSLLLSGAFGGLVGALPPDEFLPAANAYLLRQEWDEGFATAIHVHLDTATGDFEIRKAGHPPAVWLQAGSGSWRVLDSDGPALGLLPAMDFPCIKGTLRYGDALMLYTDGVVETPRKDYTSGIDRLAGRGQRLFQTGFDKGATRVLDELDQTGDDRALVLIHRQ